MTMNSVLRTDACTGQSRRRVRNSGRLDCKGLPRETEQSGWRRASLFIDMPLARLCIFVDGLVELQLDGIGLRAF